MLGQGANNVLDLLLLCGGGQDRGVAQHAVIQSVLGLEIKIIISGTSFPFQLKSLNGI